MAEEETFGELEVDIIRAFSQSVHFYKQQHTAIR